MELATAKSNPKIPSTRQPNCQSATDTSKGINEPAAITPIVLPASTSAKLKPRLVVLAHLWVKAITGAQQAAHPNPTIPKKTLACQSEPAYCIRKVPNPMMAMKTEMMSLML